MRGSRGVEERLPIDDRLPDRVSGYEVLEYLSLCGWRFGVVAAVGGGVLILGVHDWGAFQVEARAQAASVELAAPDIFRQARELGLTRLLDSSSGRAA
jgi:hypothetical protein